MDIEKTLKELVALGLTKGEKYGHGASSAFALGYLRQAVESAILRLPAKQQKIVLDDLKHAIAAGQRSE